MTGIRPTPSVPADGELPSTLARDSEVTAAIAAERTSERAHAAGTYAPLASPALTGTPTVNGTPIGTGAGGPPDVTTVAAAGSSRALVASSTAETTVYDLTLNSASCAFSITAVPALAGKRSVIELIMRQDATGGRLATWPVAMTWPGGTSPTLAVTASRYDVLQLVSRDGWASYEGFQVGMNLQTPAVPGQVTGLSAQASDGSVLLSYSLPAANGSAITGYKIYRGTVSGTRTLLATTTGAPLTYTDSTVTNGTTYYYSVAAENGIGIGAQSSEVNASPVAVVTKVLDTFTGSAGTNVVGHSPDTNTVGFAWATNTSGAVFKLNGSGLLYLDSATSQAILQGNATVSDCTVSMDHPSALLDGGPVFRYTDDNNLWTISAQSGILYKKVAGTFTQVGSTWSPAGAGVHLDIVLLGTSIKVYQGGVLVLSATDSFNQTAPRHGVRINGGSAGATFVDNFKITVP